MPKPVLQVPTVTESGALVGRPRKQPPPDAALQIVKLAAEGRPIRGIALKLDTSFDTFKRWTKESPGLEYAFELGREQRRHELEEILMRDARDGAKPNVNAIFLLKARYGYREGDQGDQPSRVNITVNLPGAMSREDYMKTVIEHE